MKHKRLVIGSAVVFVASLVGASLYITLIRPSRSADPAPVQTVAQQIPSGTSFTEVRKLSLGTKPKCLSADTSLQSVIDADDKLPYSKQFSSAFALAINDMPAGFVDVYLHKSNDVQKTGYAVFSDKNQQSTVKGLDSFNFTVKRLSYEQPWKLTSYIACQKT